MKRGSLVQLHPDTSVDELTDEGLVAACATGDRAARALLFERHVDAVHRFINAALHVAAKHNDDPVKVEAEKKRREPRADDYVTYDDAKPSSVELPGHVHKFLKRATTDQWRLILDMAPLRSSRR